jgi:hypothetical protein
MGEGDAHSIADRVVVGFLQSVDLTRRLEAVPIGELG